MNLSLRLLALLIISCISIGSHAQVGINTVEPKADLEILANSNPGLNNYNGVIIPKVSSLPTTSDASFPGVNQAGLLLYLNTTDATQGIYLFNGVDYVKLEPASASGAFYNTGTTDFTTTITNNIERQGNVSIGSPLNSAKLNVDVVSNVSAADPIGIKVENNNTGIGATDNYGIFIENNSTGTTNGDGDGIKYGLRNDVSSSGNSERVGIFNNVRSSSESTTRGVIGIDNAIGATSGASSLNIGIRSVIGTPGSNANSYGIYSIARGNDSRNNYSGYFQGDKFAIRNEDDSDGYELPTMDGNVNEVLTTDGNGIVSWNAVTRTIALAAGGSNDAVIESSTGSSDITLTGSTGIIVTEDISTGTITLSAALRNTSSFPLWTSSEYELNAVANSSQPGNDHDLSNVTTVIFPEEFNTTGNIQVRVVVRVTSGQINARFQLKSYDSSNTSSYIMTTTDISETFIGFGSVFNSDWVDYNAGIGPKRIQLTGFKNNPNGDDIKFNSAYLEVRSQ